MERKANMSNVDELCVKYVFDELDPSEITLVEEAMIQDQNLLIEVESLKSTWRKLKKMPEMHPPENISKAIIEQAREHSSQQQMFGKRWKNPGLMATAAVVIFSLLISTAYLLPDNEPASNTSGDTMTAGTGKTAGTVQSNIESVEQALTPSFDRQNMIFIGTSNKQEEAPAPDSLTNREVRFSGQKGENLVIPHTGHNYQLTGTGY